MSSCNTIIDSYQSEDGTLAVSEKYIQLMQDSMSDESLYIRAKDTLAVIFEDIQITEKEKAELVLSYITQFSTSISSVAMQSAISWTKEERDGAYTLAKSKADTELALANFELIKSQICKTDKEAELACAKVTSESAGSIRENGRVSSYGSDGCSVESLRDEGTKYQQEKQIVADTYSRFADAFRKSGVVQIGTDIQDNIVKGLSGDEDGLTQQQQQNHERLRISYEDSKRSHAANSSASMIASMLTAEIAPKEQDVQRWRDALDYLNASHSSTSNS